MPAEYGGRLSSVLDITMKDGNNKKYEAVGGIGLLSSRLTIEGPVQKEKVHLLFLQEEHISTFYLNLLSQKIMHLMILVIIFMI